MLTMIAGMKQFRGILMGVALIATLFGLVQAPLSASAMHVGMVRSFTSTEEASVSHMLMTPAFMSIEEHVEAGCSDVSCSAEAACLRHCLERATSRDAEVVLLPQTQVQSSAIQPQRVTYPTEGDDPDPVDQYVSRPDARSVLLTTHKRE